MSSSAVNTAAVQQWLAEKLDIQKVKDKITAIGYDEETAALYLKEFNKIRYKKRQTAGFVCLAAGALLGFISCVLTLINPIPELYNWILYGLTSVAVGIIVLGLYYLLE